MMTLMADALQMVDIRLRQLIAGEGTPTDVFLMVTEKMDAAAEARTIFLRSGRRIVSANIQRLSG